ncbi:MAG: aspartate ammonia-lyase [Bacillota bacterium]
MKARRPENTATRTERDFLGEVEVPQEAYYGIATVRAAANFPVSGQKVHPELIKSMALVKQAAALANVEAGLLDRRIGEAIARAAAEVASGALADQFIVDAFQGGAGTSTNMNMNEVLANRAIEILGGTRGDYSLVHPLDHINLSQSTNDTYPTALRIAAIRLLRPLTDAFAALQSALQAKEAQFAGVLKPGRTQLQDAVPITLGQEFSAWAEAVARDRWRLYKMEERLRQVNLGGTAVGSGLGADRRYVFGVIEKLRELTGLGLARAENTVDPTQNADVFVEVSGLLKAGATSLAKISGDLRLLSSGPGAGLAEIALPQLQPGSSIMPGKVNPVVPEMVTQVAYQVIASDLAITLAAQAGQLELNAFLPLVAHHLLGSMAMLTRTLEIFVEKCVRGITADEQRCRDLLERSDGLATALVPHIGYTEACRVLGEAHRRGRPLAQVVAEKGFLPEEDVRVIFSKEELTRPGIPGSRLLKKRPTPVEGPCLRVHQQGAEPEGTGAREGKP